MKPVINSNKHPFIKWLKNNPDIIFEWFAILLIIIIANVFTWFTTGSFADKLCACAMVTMVTMVFAALMTVRDMHIGRH